MNIYITNYTNGVVRYMYDHIPSEMAITNQMIKETFVSPNWADCAYKMVKGMIDQDLEILIRKYHTVTNNITRVYNGKEVYLDYQTL